MPVQVLLPTAVNAELEGLGQRRGSFSLGLIVGDAMPAGDKLHVHQIVPCPGMKGR